MKLPDRLFRYLIAPRSTTVDRKRQEFTFNVLIVGLMLAALTLLIITTVDTFSSSITHFGQTHAITLGFMVLLGLLIALSRAGYFRLSSILFVALLTIVTIQLLLQWGFMLPMVLLMQVLLIVIIGTLFGARQGLYFAVATTSVTLVVGYLYEQGQLQPDTSWLSEPFRISDAIGYAVIFMVVELVSWLSNREIDRSLKRARRSEAALAAERDSLEAKVAERTHQFEETQLVRLMELQRFAEFGRLSANLLHELANPLTAASLNLEVLGKGQSRQVSQARKNLKHMERYITAARQQIRGITKVRRFSVKVEIKQLLRILEPRASAMGVRIVYTQASIVSLWGDPVKFSQLVSNLLVNAVDAYGKKSTAERIITLHVTTNDQFVVLSVHDNGSGLSEEQLTQVFEPFYTTKTTNPRNLGIGLVMVKQFVEHDYEGKIAIQSSKAEGTTFIVKLRQRP